MIRISLPYIFQLNSSIDGLSQLIEADQKYSDIFITLFTAENAIRELSENSVYAPYLRSSRQLADELLGLLNRHTRHEDFEHNIRQIEIWLIKNKYSEYKIALLSELGVLDSFFVTQKGGYNSTSLLGAGEQLFSSDLTDKVPDAVFDAREAAKCIAYEVPTAAGFHLFRVTEAVLRGYYAEVTGGSAPPKVRSIGVYLAALERAEKGDSKVRASLKQMTDLHRNPLIHPEAVLTMDEALAIAGIARSVTTVMLAEMPEVLPTTTSAASTNP